MAHTKKEKLGKDESIIVIPGVNESPKQEQDPIDDEVEIVMGTEADVTKEDLALLGDDAMDMDGGDDELAANTALDDIDDDGDALNEGVDMSGKDLDIPGTDEDLPEGVEENDDEENDFFSLGGDDQDDNDNGTPNEYREEK